MPFSLPSLNPFEVREVLQELWGCGRRTWGCLNPFEVREVLQVNVNSYDAGLSVSIPLKSGRCCKVNILGLGLANTSLNPFEVREVLQGSRITWWQNCPGLNPFEVREVLQVSYANCMERTATVSIPLKSGRCCKGKHELNKIFKQSQSLWSQGGAASNFGYIILLFLLVSIPLKSGRCCKSECQRIGHDKKVSIPLKSGRCCKCERDVRRRH